MNPGLILSLTAGLVWSVGNAIDKVSVSKIVRSPLGLWYIFVILSVLTGLTVLPFATHQPAGTDLIRFFGIGVLYSFGTFCYFWAMQKEEPSRVVPLYSLVVLFLAVFGALFLDEVFSFVTYIAIALLIIGTIGITAHGSFRSVLSSRALGIMVLSSLGYALAYVLMKGLLNSYTPYDVFAYQRMATGLVGLLFLPFAYHHMKGILLAIPRKRLIGWSFLSEFFGESGAFLFIIAASVWYVTLVETVVNIQFVFIFLWGFIVTKTWPRLYTEVISRRVIFQKAVSIALIIIGIAIISR
ncbi:MAG: DMT family transporter [Patescibacteria group bacterium]